MGNNLLTYCKNKNVIAAKKCIIKLKGKNKNKIRSILHKVDEYNRNSLIYLCIHNIPNLAMKLLKLDCNPKQIDIYNKTPLMYACENKMREVVNYMINNLDCNLSYMYYNKYTNRHVNALTICIDRSLQELAIKIFNSTSSEYGTINNKHDLYENVTNNHLYDLLAHIIIKYNFIPFSYFNRYNFNFVQIIKNLINVKSSLKVDKYINDILIYVILSPYKRAICQLYKSLKGLNIKFYVNELVYYSCMVENTEFAIKLLELDTDFSKYYNNYLIQDKIINNYNGKLDEYDKNEVDYAIKNKIKNNETVLILACRKNLPNIVEVLLTKKCNLAYIDGHNANAFLYTCKNKMSLFSLKLIEMDCQVDIIDDRNCNPLLYACHNNMNTVSMKIIEIGCNTYQSGNCNRKLKLGHQKTLSVFGSYYKDCDYIKQTYYHTALIQACINKMWNVVEALIPLNCNAGYINDKRISALKLLFESKKKKLIELLFKLHFDELCTGNYYDELVIACNNKWNDIALTMTSLKFNSNILRGDALLSVCINNMSNVALKLIDIGDNKSIIDDEYMYTTLMHTLYNKMEKVSMKLLTLKSHIDSISYCTKNGMEAIIIAIQSNMLNVVKKIIKLYPSHTDMLISSEIKRQCGYPILYACKNKLIDIVWMMR